MSPFVGPTEWADMSVEDPLSCLGVGLGCGAGRTIVQSRRRKLGAWKMIPLCATLRYSLVPAGGKFSAELWADRAAFLQPHDEAVAARVLLRIDQV